MKTLNITIKIQINGDEDDSETVQSEVYSKLQELMDSEELNFSVSVEDEDE